MPSALNSIPKWERPQKTKYELDWADLSIIDLSEFDQPGGKQKLADQLKNAVHRDGFFSVIGTGFTDEEVDRQYAIGQNFFSHSLEEKKQSEDLCCDFSTGNYFGYKPAHEKKVKGTHVTDNIESLNIPKFNNHYESDARNRHPLVRPFFDEIKDFQLKCFETARKIFILFALILELPENYFVDRHLYENKSDDHLRYIIYRPRSEEDDALVDNTWSRSHTDFGSLTLLFNQNVAGLQIRTLEGEWKYVKPLDGGIVCNVGDTLQFWSAGYLRSTIHRVQRPPPDQANIHRLGLIYFVRPGDNSEIQPAPSPLLKRLGLISDEQFNGNQAPVTGLEYVRSRVKNYHHHNDYADKRGEKFVVGNLVLDDEVV